MQETKKCTMLQRSLLALLKGATGELREGAGKM
jgi:hypothetical protein